MGEMNSGAMTFARFLEWASIGRTKAYEEAKAGRLRLTKIGSKTLVLRSDAEAWLARYANRQNAA
jgi:hypothetical protein